MDANNQDKIENKTPVAQVKPSTPSSVPTNQANKVSPQKDHKKANQTPIVFGALFIIGIVLIFIGLTFNWSMWIIISLILIEILLLLVLLFPTKFDAQWTGFWGYDKVTKEYSSDEQLAKITREHQPGKTIWDWLQLLGVLAIPIAVTIFGSTFSASIAEQQAATSRIIAQDQEQETALQQYLDSMSTLLANKDLQDPIKGAQLRQVARARTVVALTTLIGTRRGTVFQFLLQSNLINITNTIVDLRRINLEEITLRGANLTQLNFREADLGYADLSNSFLNKSNLSGSFLAGTVLNGADLSYADLSYSNLRGASLFGANLTNANLKGAFVTSQQLAEAKSLQGAIMPDGSRHP